VKTVQRSLAREIVLDDQLATSYNFPGPANSALTASNCLTSPDRGAVLTT
jgi:hypothetical protein